MELFVAIITGLGIVSVGFLAAVLGVSIVKEKPNVCFNRR